MTLAGRASVIVQILDRWDELTEPGERLGIGGDDDAQPRMPTTYTPTVREIERLLKIMRDERRSQWWHVTERYLRSEVRVLELPVKQGVYKMPPHTVHVAGAAHRGDKTVRVTAKAWNPAVRAEKVRRGVAWLAASWSLPHEPMLPQELLAA